MSRHNKLQLNASPYSTKWLWQTFVCLFSDLGLILLIKLCIFPAIRIPYMVCCLELVFFVQGSRRDREIKRREVDLDPQVSPQLDFFRFELFLNSTATEIVLVTLPKHGR